MHFKFLSVVAAALLLAACSSNSDNSSASAGGGSSSASGSSVSQAVPGSQEDMTIQVGDRILFDFDSAEIRVDMRSRVDALAAWLKANPGAALELQGHADERGTTEYNLALGERRANSVREYLVALGIQSGRLNVVSYGEERPVVAGSTEAAWAQNRRAQFVVQ